MIQKLMYGRVTFAVVLFFTGTVVVSEVATGVPGHAVLSAWGLARVALRVAREPLRPRRGKPICGPVYRLNTNVRQSEKKSERYQYTKSF